jgi:cytidylate kinase
VTRGDAASSQRAVAALARAAPPRAGTTRVIAIDGPSGSGKTTWAGGLAATLDAPLVHLEDFYPGWDGLAATLPRLRDWVLRPLAEGAAAGYRRFDWVRGAYAEWHEVPVAGTLVVEGVGSGALLAAPFLSLLVWVEAPALVRRERALARDGDTYAPHWERWARQEEAYFAADRPRDRAQAIVDTTRLDDVAVTLTARDCR